MIYRPPTSDDHGLTFNTLIDDLSTSFVNLIDFQVDLLTVRDLNVQIKKKLDSDRQIYTKSVQSSLIRWRHCVASTYTHVKNNSPSVLALIIQSAISGRHSTASRVTITS